MATAVGFDRDTPVVWVFDRTATGGFHSHGATPLSLDGLFAGKSRLKMDDTLW